MGGETIPVIDKHGWTGDTDPENFPLLSLDKLTNDELGLVDMMAVETGKYVAPRFPVSWISDGGQSVDEENIADLNRRMDEERERDGGDSTGQNSPIQVRIVVGDLEKTRDTGISVVTDGFHRRKIAEINERHYIWAVVKEATWDEILDDRIKETEDHTAINFGRRIDWVTQSWNLQPLSEKISAQQAFRIASLDANTGAQSGVASEELEDLYAWIESKANIWNLEPKTIFNHLQRADVVDSSLIYATKTGKGGASKESDHISQAHIDAFFRAIPKQYELQKRLAPVAIENGLSGPKLRALCEQLSGLEGDRVEAGLDAINLDDIQPKRQASQARVARKKSNPFRVGEELGEKADADLLDIVGTLEVLLGRDKAYRPDKEGLENAEDAKEKLKNMGARIVKIAKLMDEVTARSAKEDAEKAEQDAIKAQAREDAKAIKEAEKARAKAQKEIDKAEAASKAAREKLQAAKQMASRADDELLTRRSNMLASSAIDDNNSGADSNSSHSTSSTRTVSKELNPEEALFDNAVGEVVFCLNNGSKFDREALKGLSNEDLEDISESLLTGKIHAGSASTRRQMSNKLLNARSGPGMFS